MNDDWALAVVVIGFFSVMASIILGLHWYQEMNQQCSAWAKSEWWQDQSVNIHELYDSCEAKNWPFPKVEMPKYEISPPDRQTNTDNLKASQ